MVFGSTSLWGRSFGACNWWSKEEYEKDPYHEILNPKGIIQMGLAENQLSFDLLEFWLAKNPDAAGFKRDGPSIFRELDQVRLNISPESSCHCTEPGWFRRQPPMTAVMKMTLEVKA